MFLPALPLPTDQDMIALPPFTRADELRADYAVSGLSPRYHPIGLLRPALAPDVVSSPRLGALRDGARARVAGMIVCRQRPPTAKGFAFLTLEDLRRALGVPVVGLEPAVKTAVARTRVRRIAVMATSGTLRSERFARLLRAHADGVAVTAQA